MILVPTILLLAIAGSVHPYKFYFQAAQTSTQAPLPQEDDQRIEGQLPYYPQQQIYSVPFLGSLPPIATPQSQLEGIKGGDSRLEQRPLLLQPQAPQALAYVIIRPIQPQYLDRAPIRQPAYERPELPARGIKGQHEEPAEELKSHPVTSSKSGRDERIEEQQQQITQQHEDLRQPQMEKQQQEEIQDLHQSKRAKFLRLKAHLEQLAHTAKSKLSFASYRVVGEELVTTSPQPPRQEMLQQQEQIPDKELEQLPQQQLQQDELEDSRVKGSPAKQPQLLPLPAQQQVQDDGFGEALKPLPLPPRDLAKGREQQQQLDQAPLKGAEQPLPSKGEPIREQLPQQQQLIPNHQKGTLM